MSEPDVNLQAAVNLISETILLDGASEVEGSTEDDQPNQDRFTNRVKIIVLMLDGIDEEWLRKQIEDAERYESTGFLTDTPFNYQMKTVEVTPDVKELARLLLDIKKLRVKRRERDAAKH